MNEEHPTYHYHNGHKNIEEKLNRINQMRESDDHVRERRERSEMQIKKLKKDGDE